MSKAENTARMFQTAQRTIAPQLAAGVRGVTSLASETNDLVKPFEQQMAVGARS